MESQIDLGAMDLGIDRETWEQQPESRTKAHRTKAHRTKAHQLWVFSDGGGQKPTAGRTKSHPIIDQGGQNPTWESSMYNCTYICKLCMYVLAVSILLYPCHHSTDFCICYCINRNFVTILLQYTLFTILGVFVIVSHSLFSLLYCSYFFSHTVPVLDLIVVR